MPKLRVLIMLMAILVAGLSRPADAGYNEIMVYVDGANLLFPDQKPLINNDNRTLVPVRFISEALGADVAWCSIKRTVEVNHQGKHILLEIGQHEALVDKNTITLDTQAEVHNSRTMVPLRFVSECLGAGVEWNGAAREIYITTAAAQPVKAFTGQPFKQEVDLPTSEYLGYKIYRANEPGAKVSYITADQLPAQVGEYIIFSLDVDDEYVHIKQRSLSGSIRPIPMHIKEDRLLTRARHYGDGQQGIYTYSYPLTLNGEIADGIGKADKAKIEAFAFDDITNNLDLEMLVIINPLYKGES